jgi:hypothetical protein
MGSNSPWRSVTQGKNRSLSTRLGGLPLPAPERSIALRGTAPAPGCLAAWRHAPSRIPSPNTGKPQLPTHSARPQREPIPRSSPISEIPHPAKREKPHTRSHIPRAPRREGRACLHPHAARKAPFSLHDLGANPSITQSKKSPSDARFCYPVTTIFRSW